MEKNEKYLIIYKTKSMHGPNKEYHYVNNAFEILDYIEDIIDNPLLDYVKIQKEKD